MVFACKASLCNRLSLLVATLALPNGLTAQVVTGRLVDDATNQPIGAATIQLLGGDRGDSTVAAVVTNERGEFVLRAPVSGTFRLRTSRIGYEASTTPAFELGEGDAPLEVEVRISAAAVLLAPLTIVSDRAPFTRSSRLSAVGYYERKEMWGNRGMGFGQFLEGDEIMRTNPFYVSDVLRTMRGVWVQARGGRRLTITFRGHFRIGGGRCVPLVFVDGAPVATGADIDDVVTPSSLAAIEVYPGLSKPGEFMHPRSQGCGTVALWTGLPEERRGPPDDTVWSPPRGLAERDVPLQLRLALSTDSATSRDSVWASLTIHNASDDSVSICIADARYTVRGPRVNQHIVSEAGSAPCARVVEVPPAAAHSWQELLAFVPALSQSDEFLIQKRLTIRDLRCGNRDECQFEVLSEVRRLVIERR